MEDYLYRYIPFESFVGMVQKQVLTFVLPELWDDPCESSWFMRYMSQIEDSIERLTMLSVHCQTYCQCWTKLSESDAMWRIYSYGNRAVRIRIKRSDIEKLEDVHALDVKYTDNPQFPKDISEESFSRMISLKRTAFEHEIEVRLVKHYRFLSEEDFKRHYMAWMAIKGNSKSLEIAEELFPNCTMDQQVEGIAGLLNIGTMAKETLDISFSHMPQFIDGVMIHPFAPEWYVDIVKDFCDNNSVPFEGKSNLYAE